MMVCPLCGLPCVPMGGEEVCLGHEEARDSDPDQSNNSDEWDYEGSDIDGAV